MSSKIISIKSYAPSIRIDSVWLINEDKDFDNILKLPVVAIKETVCEYEGKDEYENPDLDLILEFINVDGDGFCEENDYSEYFIGYEFNGEKKDWIEEIAKRKEEIKKKIANKTE
jgi:hypothetical protein